MRPSRRAVSAAFVLAASVLALGCSPTFEPVAGANLTVAGAPFQPNACHVLETGTGIELLDAAGRRVELTLPPAPLEYQRQVNGVPTVKVRTGANQPTVEVGLCGTLSLTGEGYHAPTKRAASGNVALDCVGTVALHGRMQFSGCF